MGQGGGVTDPDVIARSGSDTHPILRPAPGTNLAVEGMVFVTSDDELQAADSYEVDSYKRVLVPLRSGRRAWYTSSRGIATGFPGRSGRGRGGVTAGLT